MSHWAQDCPKLEGQACPEHSGPQPGETADPVTVLEREHVRESKPVSQFNPAVFWCEECDHQWPCLTLALIARVRALEAEVERLKAALQAIVVILPDGPVCFRKETGFVYPEMTANQARLVRAALDGGKEK